MSDLSGTMMEKVEDRTRIMKAARKNFYEPDVQYERLTPFMKAYLARVGEAIVNACSRSMAEEAKRAAILAAMPQSSPGYAATARDFDLVRVSERKAVEKLLNDRDQKVAKATRFQKHIPPPSTASSWGDNEEWVNAVMQHSTLLGIDTKHELDYELLPLAAEALELPLPPGWVEKRGGFRAEVKNSAASVNSHESQGSSGDSNSSSNPHNSKKTLVSYVNQSTGAILFEHPLNGYFRNIVASRKLARELQVQGKDTAAALAKCASAEEAMRGIMDHMLRGPPSTPGGGRSRHKDGSINSNNNLVLPRPLGHGLEELAALMEEAQLNQDWQAALVAQKQAARRFHIEDDRPSTHKLPLAGAIASPDSRIPSVTYRNSLQRNYVSPFAATNPHYRQPNSTNHNNQTNRAGVLLERLPRMSLQEAGVQVGGNRTSDQSTHLAGGGIITTDRGGGGDIFQWTDEPTSGGSRSPHPSRSSRQPRTMLEQARLTRQQHAHATDPHTQRVAQPSGPPLDPQVYTSSRRALPLPPTQPGMASPGSRQQQQQQSQRSALPRTRGGGTRSGGSSSSHHQSTRQATQQGDPDGTAGFLKEYWEEDPWAMTSQEGREDVQQGDTLAVGHPAAVTFGASSSNVMVNSAGAGGTGGGTFSPSSRAGARTSVLSRNNSQALSSYITDF